MIKVLSELITHIGKNAIGRRHLVEILYREDLHRIKFSRFEKRLQEAESAFEVVTAYLNKDAFEDKFTPILAKITSFSGALH